MSFSLDTPGITRFLKYALVGGSTFAFDLLILWVAADVLGVPYYFSTPLCFAIAVSINYFLARHHVFKGTERPIHTGYAYFLTVAGGGALLVTGAVSVLVTYAAFHYLVARILVACVMGMLNYLFNLHFNFKVVGKPH